MKSISLKSQLLKSTIKTCIALAFFGFVAVSSTALYQNSSVFDELLAGNAQALLGENGLAYPDIDQGLQHLNAEMDIEYQVVNRDGKIINQTLNTPTSPYLHQFDNQTFYNVWHNGEWLRIYTAYDHTLNRYVQIAQPWEQRIDFALPVIANYMGFILLALLVLAAANIWALNKALRPLHQMTSAIHTRHLQKLTPIEPTVVVAETKPLLSAINELFERLIKAKESQERFTADASHELRTPLAAIQMKLQLLQRRFATQDEVVRSIDEVRFDANRMATLVDSLLMLARLDADQNYDTEKQTMAVARLPIWAATIQDEFLPKFTAQQSVLRCQTELCQSSNRVILLNEQLMFVAIKNLLDNALKYAGQGVTVELLALPADDGVWIGVQDDGIGVTPADRQKLSERFFRVLGNQATGSGLGLSIVAKITEYHGATLKIDAGIDGKGLGVLFKVPYANQPTK